MLFCKHFCRKYFDFFSKILAKILKILVRKRLILQDFGKKKKKKKKEKAQNGKYGSVALIKQFSFFLSFFFFSLTVA